MLFNQQQCFIYSTARFLSKLRASTNDGLPEISKMKYWILEPGRTTISGFTDSKKNKMINVDRP
jgi:hypothetical protein